LELLAYVLLVKKLKAISPDGFRKLEAEDKLRLLLHTAKIPSAVPVRLHRIVADLPNFDGPAAITAIRNDLIHPGDPAASSFTTVHEYTRAQVWVLGLQYFELALLYSLGYMGKVCYRAENDWGYADRNVPWTN